MAEGNQSLKVQGEKKAQRRAEPTPAEIAQELAGLGQVLGGPMAAFDGGSIEGQAARLGDARLQPAQRRSLAARIGKVQGNLHLQRVFSSIDQDEERLIPRPEPQSALTQDSGAGQVIQREGGGGEATGGGGTVPSGGQQVRLPTPIRLSRRDRRLLDAVLRGASILPGIGPMVSFLQTARSAATTFGVTVAVGPSVAGGFVGGASAGYGIYFGPGGEIGGYGTVGGRLGAIFGISGTLQVTVVGGGPENLGGTCIAVGAGGGELIVGGAAVLLNTDGSFLGVSMEVGIGAGLSPVEFYVEMQHTWESQPAAVAAPAAVP